MTNGDERGQVLHCDISETDRQLAEDIDAQPESHPFHLCSTFRRLYIDEPRKEPRMSTAQASTLIIFLSMGLVGFSPADTPSPPTEIKLENLLRQSLTDEFIPDREIIVSYVEMPPNMTLDRHWHPGEEFHYYLEGEVEIVIDGETSIIGTPGTVGYVPFKKMHTATTGDKSATFLVFRVHTEGKPVRYLEDGGTSEQ